jgi:hypothetical protein
LRPNVIQIQEQKRYLEFLQIDIRFYICIHNIALFLSFSFVSFFDMMVNLKVAG